MFMTEQSDRLRKAREQANFTSPKAASDFFGWNEHTYKSHENGNRGFKLHAARKYAQAFGIDPGWLMTGSGDSEKQEFKGIISIPVQGDAAGGRWIENEDAADTELLTLPIPPDPRYPPSMQYARRVVGNSVSNQIKSGEFAIVVRLDSYPGGIKDGALVDVERVRAGLREHSIKVYHGNQLMTDSAEMDEQQAIEITNGESDTEVRIVGIVVGAFRPL